MSLLEKSLESIIKRLETSDERKHERLERLRQCIESIQDLPNISMLDYYFLRAECIESLNDDAFTYKQFTFFNQQSSCTRLAIQIIYTIELKLGMELLNQLPEDFALVKNDKLIIKYIQNKRYQELNEYLGTNYPELYSNDWQGLAFCHWIGEKLALPKLDLLSQGVHLTPAEPLTGWSEHNPSQYVYDIDELQLIMQRSRMNTRIGFIYVVDENGNPFFSRGTSSVHHCNVCQRRDCYGAGEIYLSINEEGQIFVHTLNNRSGLYKPDTTHFDALLDCLGDAGFNCANTACNNETSKMFRDLVVYRPRI